MPGDGVGPDVVTAAKRVLAAAAARFGFEVAWTDLVVGGAGIDAYGVAIRDEDLAACAASDAVLLGAVGGPRWDDPRAAVRPEQALFAMRGGLGLFANLRPVTVHPALVPASPLRPELLAGVDLLIVRELTGGLYFGSRSEAAGAAGARAASDTLPYAEGEVARVARLAFDLARGRRRQLTSVDKANVLATSRLWRTVVHEIAAEYPDVALDDRLVDACAMQLVTKPSSFDVLVTENLFGDILSDEASVLAGSLGMLPSASVGTRRTAHGLHGLYEPIHGSAPDIAGRDLANPVGTVLSAAMLLRWSLGRADAAEAVEAAVAGVLDDGFRTADLWPRDPAAAERCTRVGTVGMADAIVARIGIPGAAA
ncbi:MAG: 3-isopropylmalate dehydrogenase [Chloroflexi bacterium]|nr:3-isopropylmalate dehydrogenase [Chloroflexota bacterium]